MGRKERGRTQEKDSERQKERSIAKGADKKGNGEGTGAEGWQIDRSIRRKCRNSEWT